MNDRETRRTAITASVIVFSGFTLAGGQWIAADVDRSRRDAESAVAPNAQPIVEASQAPAQGLVRAPAPPRRRIVVVRRTRAS